MALSMDEQRMLAEIEQRLVAEDPVLAARLSAFRRPSRVSIFRSARARVIGSLLTVAVVAMVSLMVYAILPFRSGSRTSGHPVTVSSTGTGQPKIGVGPGAKTARNTAGTNTTNRNTTNRNTTRSASAAASAPAKSTSAKGTAARAASGSTVRQSASYRASSAAARGSSGTTAQPASTAGQSP